LPQTHQRQAQSAELYPANMRVIKATTELARACEDLARHEFVAVDTEFMRETTFWPKLCLIQLAGPQAECIVDPLAPGVDLAPFYALMANPRVVKVFHAGRQDLEIVWKEARLIPHPLFDTQVAAMVCGFGESISYVNLVKQITGQDVDKTSRFTDWSRRPLSTRQLSYALGDVTHLREIYKRLKHDLEQSGRASWLDEEMASLTAPETYRMRPEDAWKRLKLRVQNRKNLAVLIELAAWRERLAQSLDVPRNRVLRDEALYDIANHAPTDTSQLAALRTLTDGFARSARAKEIVEVVLRGQARDLDHLPAIHYAAALPADKVALVDLLRVLLKSCAARYKVAPRLIADTDDLERIAVEPDPDVPALKGWRRDLFGAEALSLKRGELALAVDGGEVIAIPSFPPRLPTTGPKKDG
jgi:ribonuclease D